MLGTLERRLRALFDLPTSSDDTPTEHELQVATAVLLFEMMRTDADLAETERAAVVSALREKFALDDAQTAQLLVHAEAEADAAADFHRFTSRLNKGFTLEQKIRVIESLWQVAFADGRIDDHEHHLLRKLGELLYIPRGDYVAAKARARQRSGAA